MGTASQHGPPPPYESVIMSDAVSSLATTSKMPQWGGFIESRCMGPVTAGCASVHASDCNSSQHHAVTSHPLTLLCRTSPCGLLPSRCLSLPPPWTHHPQAITWGLMVRRCWFVLYP